MLSGYRGAGPVVGVRSVLMDSDVVHLNYIMVKDEVVVRGGSIVKGSILAEGRVTVEARGTPSLIAGDIGVIGERGSFVVEGASPLVVLGDVLAGRVEVKSPTLLLGNIAALSEVKIENRVLVLGRVVVGTEGTPGRLSVENSSLHHCYAFGDIRLGRGVTVFTPLIASRGGELSLEGEKVRVLSFPCIFCSEVDNPLLCEHYIEGRSP